MMRGSLCYAKVAKILHHWPILWGTYRPANRLSARRCGGLDIIPVKVLLTQLEMLVQPHTNTEWFSSAKQARLAYEENLETYLKLGLMV
eukprot:10295184-Karenia_brevis.AAC.1